MHEKVPVALIGRDEAVALLVVEPLDRTGRHAYVLPLSSTAPVSASIPFAAALCFRSRSGYRAKSTTMGGWRERREANTQRPWKVALPGPSSRKLRTAFCRSSVAKRGA